MWVLFLRNLGWGEVVSWRRGIVYVRGVVVGGVSREVFK